MLNRLIFGIVLCLPSIAMAGDSTWLWCHGIAERGKPVTKTHFAASVHEHRDSTGAARELAVTLVYGDHQSRGIVAKSEVDKAGALTTKAFEKPANAVFTGTAKLDPRLETLTLAGKLDENFGEAAKPSQVPFTAKLTCETLDDLAIGH